MLDLLPIRFPFIESAWKNSAIGFAVQVPLVEALSTWYFGLAESPLESRLLETC
jgi:hypothetical protein